MRALLVELRRIRSRRAVIVLLVAAFLFAAAVFATTAWNTRPHSEQEKKEFLEQVEIQRQDPAALLELDRCERNPERYGISKNDPDIKHACDLAILPQPEWFGTRPELDLRTELTGSGTGVIAILSVLLVLAGTTFAGHDWSSGSMSNQLLFEPRRLRLWIGKALAVLFMSLLIGAAVLAAYWAALWFVADRRGLTPDPPFLDTVQATGVRGLLFVAAAGLGGYALTMLFRSTVASLGTLFALSIMAPLMLALVGFDGYERWMPNVNFSAIVHDGATYYDNSRVAECASDIGCGQVTLSLLGGSLYFGVMLAVVVVLSMWSFRRRDVP